MRHGLVCFTLFVLVLVSPSSASAQDVSKAEVALGYTIHRDQRLEGTSTRGWLVSPAVRLNTWLSVVADVGANYRTVDDVAGSETAVFGGPRFRYNWSSGNVYWQLLFGVKRSNYDGDTTSESAAQSGVGVTLDVAPKWSLRLETGGRVGRSNYSFWRGAIGVVYRVGTR